MYSRAPLPKFLERYLSGDSSGRRTSTGYERALTNSSFVTTGSRLHPASGTVWGFRAYTLRDWEKRRHRSGVVPIDLVLDGDECNPRVSFDEHLRDTSRNYVVWATVRQVHLKSSSGVTSSSVISSLASDDEGAWNEDIESVVWRNGGIHPVDVSDFFAQSHVPKLHLLKLYKNFRVSS